MGTAAKMALPPRTRARPNGQPDPASTIERKPPRHVKFACTMEKSAPHRVLAARGWREVDDDSWDWDVMWADTGWVHDNVTYNVTTQPQRLRENQRVNHFPNHVELTRKDLRELKLANLSERLQACHAVVAAFPKDPAPLNDRYLLHSLAGDDRAACADLRKAIELAAAIPADALNGQLRSDLQVRAQLCAEDSKRTTPARP